MCAAECCAEVVLLGVECCAPDSQWLLMSAELVQKLLPTAVLCCRCILNSQIWHICSTQRPCVAGAREKAQNLLSAFLTLAPFVSYCEGIWGNQVYSSTLTALLSCSLAVSLAHYCCLTFLLFLAHCLIGSLALSLAREFNLFKSETAVFQLLLAGTTVS